MKSQQAIISFYHPLHRQRRKNLSCLTVCPSNKPSFGIWTKERDEVIVLITNHNFSETNGFTTLKDNMGAVTRAATATDTEIVIFDITNGGAYCKTLYTARNQAHKLEQLEDGSLVGGTTRGKLVLLRQCHGIL